MTRRVLVYGQPACPQIEPLLGLLKRHGVTYTYLDITEDESARNTVLALNGGSAAVPMLILADGTVLREPSLREVEAGLNVQGSPASMEAEFIEALLPWLIVPVVVLIVLHLLGVF